MGSGDKNFYTSGELVPRERNRHTRTKLGRGRKDKVTDYRPPWHRVDEGGFKMVCMPAHMFGRVSAMCQALHIVGEDAVELIAVSEQAESNATRWQALAPLAVDDVRRAIALGARDRAGVWLTGQSELVLYVDLSSEHLLNITRMLGYDVVGMLPNLHNEYKRRLLR